MSYFEKESAFRHLNELLYIIFKHKEHLLKNGELASQILITVDGGGDERPRNKLTRFRMVLLRRLLNLDKITVLSFAEGDSKLHSVERYHTCKNRALSQGGVIDSHVIKESETDEKGLSDLAKFHEYMQHAANEAVYRISQTPYANEKFKAYRAHASEDDWVFSNSLEKLIKRYLQVDSTKHRFYKNFSIKYGGKITNELCTIY
ncbi:Hypothetical predicted protein [Mytilus galloprovincialis]|uniref:Uncharacterized protein n=1 Tax=Mytilus galloprovincialis TaxID=29158 RepID=A0A8B6DJP2_MYTGA|nr:Hypothetical predicted protein [Mytilus galloprovincialis]